MRPMESALDITVTPATLDGRKFDQPVESQQLREALSSMEGLSSSEVQRFGDPTDVVIRAQVPGGEEDVFGDRIENHLLQAPQLEGREFDVVRGRVQFFGTGELNPSLDLSGLEDVVLEFSGGNRTFA